MKVLFAVNDEKDAEAITRVYQKEYKEIISSKTVYYFNAIIKELQKDKTYDRIVISEDLEMFASDNYQAVDNFIFEKMDAISDEATNVDGSDIPIILLCMDRRTKNDPLLVRLFGLGLYNVLVGQDRSVQKVAGLMYKPRTKKEAKMYYKVEPENVTYSSTKKNNEVSETEIQNILNHYKKIGNNIPKCVQAFDSIVSQYNKDQVKLIAAVLPNNTKVILEENSDSYRKIMGIKGKKALGSSELRKTEYVEKEIDSGKKLTQPVIIPTAVSSKKVNKVLSPEEVRRRKIEAKKAEAERIAKEREEEEKRKEEERIAREKEEAAKRKEAERIAKKKEAEAKKKEAEKLAKKKAEEAKKKEAEKMAKEKEETKKKENEEVVVVKRGRGRPRKNPIPETTVEDVPIKRKRGRPRKIVQEEVVEEKEELKPENLEEIISVEENVPAVKKEKKRLFADEDEKDYDLDLINEEEDDDDLWNLDDGEDEDTFDFDDLDDEEEEDTFDYDDVDDDEEDEFDFDDIEDEEEKEKTVDDEEDDDEFDFDDLDDEEEEDTFDFDDIEDEEEETDNFDSEDDEFDLDDIEDEKEKEETVNDEEDSFDFDYDDEEDDDEFDFEDLDDEEEEDAFDFDDTEENEEQEVEDAVASEEEETETDDDLFDFSDIEEDKEEEIQNQEESQNIGETEYFKDDTTTHNGSFKGILNKNYKYDNNLANSIKGLKETEEDNTSYNFETDNLITAGQKLVSFVGTTKNGTSFIVNNLAEMLSNKGIKTAILDLTKNKNSYYIYTDNEEWLREKAQNCLEKLRDGTADGIEINKNLAVYTSLPSQDQALDDVTSIIKTLLENYTVVLLDCDFDTDVRYFRAAQEIYLVQTLDILTIQPLTAFLRDLKVKNILDTNKLRVVINKNIRVNSLNDKILIGGMSVYNDPAMTYMTELFNKDTIKYTTIPFEDQVYTKYLESLVNCKISTSGYSKNFISSLNKLCDMVFPAINGKKFKNNYNDYSGQNKNFEDAFSKNTSSVLNKMKKKY